MTRWNSSGVVCSKVAKSPTPARCTQVSRRPYSSTARSATAFTCSYSEVSASRGQPPPGGVHPGVQASVLLHGAVGHSLHLLVFRSVGDHGRRLTALSPYLLY